MVVNGTVRNDYRSWGGTVAAFHHVVQPSRPEEIVQLLHDRDVTALAYGCGRSYGDVPLNPDGLLVDCRRLDRLIAFDPSTGILKCEAGVQLADILATICRPQGDGSGWFLTVSPGTRFVTVGGAIANDVHGKNHYCSGTFGRHLISLELARSDGSVSICSPSENKVLFAATIGGLGLTGIVLRATIQLRRVAGLAVELESIRFNSLDEFCDLSLESDTSWEYTAAWIDCFAAGRSLGRGVFSRARHAPGVGAQPPRHVPRLKWPTTPPFSLVNRYSVWGFNALYWRQAGLKRSHKITSYESILYPLDAVDLWNRIYGPRGFFQFQCVVPSVDAREAVAELLRIIVSSGEAPTLAALKRFGAIPSPGLLSFPMPGLTLALDFPNRGASTRRLLAQLEEIVANTSGRIYPAKDCVMRRETFVRGYPRLSEFLPMVDPGLSSAFARRVGII